MTPEQIATTKSEQDQPVPHSRDDDSTETGEVTDDAVVTPDGPTTGAGDAAETGIVGDEAVTEASEGEGDVEAADGTELSPATASGRKWGRVGIIVLAVLLLASAGLSVWLYLSSYRPAQATDAAATQSALDAAKAGTVAALSYSPENLDKDLDAAKSHLTGDFLNYYTQFTDEVVRPAVKQKNVSTTANVVRAAVSEMHPDSATVLVFVNQQTTSADRTEPSMMASSVLVTMTKTDGKWLISEFNPI